jgi:hypothetical protein
MSGPKILRERRTLVLRRVRSRSQSPRASAAGCSKEGLEAALTLPSLTLHRECAVAFPTYTPE